MGCTCKAFLWNSDLQSQTRLAYLMLAQPQRHRKTSKACVLCFCLFEGHILINIFCLQIASPAILQVITAQWVWQQEGERWRMPSAGSLLALQRCPSKSCKIMLGQVVYFPKGRQKTVVNLHSCLQKFPRSVQEQKNKSKPHFHLHKWFLLCNSYVFNIGCLADHCSCLK